jgi:hypothetical protein
MLERGHMAYVVIVVSAFVVLYAVFGCQSREEVKEELPEYVDNIEIEIQLANRADLRDMDKDDIIFTVRNEGDRIIKELSGEVVFYDSVGSEVGRTSSIFVSANPSMESIAVQEKKARWRPLPAGQAMTTGHDVVYFFGGEPDLREKVKSQWGNLAAKALIKKVVLE